MIMHYRKGIIAGVGFLLTLVQLIFGFGDGQTLFGMDAEAISNVIISGMVTLGVIQFANAPKPGTANVEMLKLTERSAEEVEKKALAIGAPVTGSTMARSPAAAMVLALVLVFGLPVGGCTFLRDISGEPTDIEVTESAEIELLRASLLYDGVLAAIDEASDPGPDQLIVPGSELANRLADAVGAATDALEVAQDAVLNDQSTLEVAVSAAVAAINRAVLIFAEAKTGE